MFRVSKTRAFSYPQRSVPSGQRKLSTQASATEKLKQEIVSASKRGQPVPTLRQLRQSQLYEDVWQSSQTPSHGAQGSDPAAQAKTAAEAYTMCHALDAVVKLSDAYDFTLTPRPKPEARRGEATAQANEHAFLEQITSSHLKTLIADFHRSWSKNNEVRQAAILSALAPKVAAQFDLAATPAHREHMQQWATPAPELQLKQSELLALVDYVNSATGTFNAVNGAAMAGAYYGDKILPGLMQVFSTALNGAIAKLCEHPYFGKTDILTFKGIKLQNISARIRRDMLESAVGTAKIIAFPNVLSTTSDPSKSYAVQKFSQGYTIECQIRMAKGFDADPFHDEMTMGESEVIGPAGQRFNVVGKEGVLVADPEMATHIEIDRYLLEPAAGKAR